ncbi:hypothetical protein [Nostoc sp. PCC 9305]|uniref:hypothetical protein n=1 Tax=Nostoc sp. PCC 9305 TaxID=296636 RepID=UPI0039C60649
MLCLSSLHHLNLIPILYKDAQNIKRTALRVHQSLTAGNPPTALVHQVRQERQE